MILFLVEVLRAVVVSVAVILVVSANTLTGSMTGTFTVSVILGSLPGSACSF